MMLSYGIAIYSSNRARVRRIKRKKKKKKKILQKYRSFDVTIIQYSLIIMLVNLRTPPFAPNNLVYIYEKCAIAIIIITNDSLEIRDTIRELP